MPWAPRSRPVVPTRPPRARAWEVRGAPLVHPPGIHPGCWPGLLLEAAMDDLGQCQGVDAAGQSGRSADCMSDVIDAGLLVGVPLCAVLESLRVPQGIPLVPGVVVVQFLVLEQFLTAGDGLLVRPLADTLGLVGGLAHCESFLLREAVPVSGPGGVVGGRRSARAGPRWTVRGFPCGPTV